MNHFDYIKSLDHHAYFIHSFKDSVEKLKNYLKDTFNIEHAQNPDFYHEKFETLGIDESRRIKENHLSKSFVAGGKRIFIIEADAMTHEAQNSLLKIFEEPHENIHFFIIMPSSVILLPTLKSRLMIMRVQSETEVESGIFSLKDIENFLKSTLKERIDFVDEIAKKISDEKLGKKDAIEFLEKLEHVLYKKGIKKNEKTLKAVLQAREYIGDRSSSIKQILEYIALNISN